jgi:hypothetical protein
LAEPVWSAQRGSCDVPYLNAETTRIMLQMEYEPDGVVETADDMLGVASHRIKADLERFKEFIESPGAATGAWRGKVERHD